MESEDLQNELAQAISGGDDEAASIAAIDAAVARGANVLDPDIAPISFATVGKRPQVIRHLYSLGATMAMENGFLYQSTEQDPGGVLRKDTALHHAAEDGWAEGVELLLSLEPSPAPLFTAYDMISRSPLICAAVAGHLDCCRVLVAHGAGVNDYDARLAGDSALAEAVDHGHAEVVRFLLDQGADVHAPGWMHITPLDRARQRAGESPEIAAMLEEAGRSG